MNVNVRMLCVTSCGGEGVGSKARSRSSIVVVYFEKLPAESVCRRALEMNRSVTIDHLQGRHGESVRAR